MNNGELAEQFLRCFCAGDLDGLASLLTADLQFKGPFHQFRSRDAYLDSLKADPPEKCDYRVLSITEDEDTVSIYYEYVKSEGILTIAQLFTFKNHRISEMLLIFDTGAVP